MNKYSFTINPINQSVKRAAEDIIVEDGRYTLPSTTLNDDELMYNFSKSVFSDLKEKGYNIEINDVITVSSPDLKSLEPNIQKSFVRVTLEQEKNDQLEKPTTKKFISRMEKNKLFKGQWVSIFSLIRDGRELSKKLRKSKKKKDAIEIINPYIQFVETDKICNHSGFLLNDIWRYFRYTWATPYKTVPGRNINILIRDSSRDYHPIIGIASLGSSVIQQSERDKWIGWHNDVAVEFLAKQRTPGKWIVESIDRLINGVYINDLKKYKQHNLKIELSKKNLEHPSIGIINELKKAQKIFMSLHRTSAKKKTKNPQINKNNDYWIKEAESFLFKSKRCRLLYKLLECRMYLNSIENIPISKNSFIDATNDKKYQKVVERIVHLVKSERVGIHLMDIMVCGSIAPYNHILGGKLVSMMLVSPEITKFYKKKYIDYSSEIASSMAGQKVKYNCDLVFLGVTSLYGVSSSQYNRLSIPLLKIGSKEEHILKFHKIGTTLGYSSLHLSERTRKLAKVLANRFEKKPNQNYSYVNYQFGEGVSPRLRLLNKALTITGLNPSKLLRHYNPKIVYGIPLIKNLYKYLLGMNQKPIFYLDSKDPYKKTKAIVNYWYERWLLMRVKNEKVLQRVNNESLAYPITHNAKVKMPKEKINNLGPLFYDVD